MIAVPKPGIAGASYLHIFEIQTQAQTDDRGEPTGVFRYRWRCCCKAAGPWRTGGKKIGQHGKASTSARRGGECHVAAMERG